MIALLLLTILRQLNCGAAISTTLEPPEMKLYQGQRQNAQCLEKSLIEKPV